ncbi:MAG: NAD(P)/FAD-dependent oxidoreductase, partial [Cellulosimicrobium funkei]
GSLGVVATLGIGTGLFEYRGLVVRGALAWLAHRGYHVLAIPTWERKVRVLAVWLTAAIFGRDVVSLSAVQRPRAAFVAGVPRADVGSTEASTAGHADAAARAAATHGDEPARVA